MCILISFAFVFSYSSRISFQTLSGRTKAFVPQPFAEIKTVNMGIYLRFRANIKLAHQALMCLLIAMVTMAGALAVCITNVVLER